MSIKTTKLLNKLTAYLTVEEILDYMIKKMDEEEVVSYFEGVADQNDIDLYGNDEPDIFTQYDEDEE